MSLKKLPPEVIEALNLVGIHSLEGDLESFFKAIKSGKNTLVSASKHSGKSTAALISIFNKVHQEYEGSPRAIYLTSTIEAADSFFKNVETVCRKLGITTDLVHDKGNIVQQRNDIFDGTEIIVGNPKRIYELYLQNGINFKLLDLFIIDDLDECLSSNKSGELKRMIESLEKRTQLVFFSNTNNKRTMSFINLLEIPINLIESNDFH